MDWLKLFKQQNQFAIGLAFVLSITGLGLSIYSLSGTKYDVIEFCFKPKRSNNKTAKYCTNDKTYIIPEGYWRQEDYVPLNPRFQPEGTFLLSEKATRLRTIPATNPIAKNWALGSLVLLSCGTLLTSKRLQRYKREFVAYFEELKTDLSQEILLNEQRRDITTHKIVVETEYIKDRITQSDQITRAIEKTDAEREFEREQAEKHNQLVEYQRLVQIARLKMEVAKSEADEAKYKNEASRYLSTITDPVELTDEIDYEALCPGKVGELDFYDWRDLADDAVGIMVVGNSGSGKTSVALWIAGWLTKDEPAQIIALDPHANVNILWKELGLYTISEFRLIQRQLELLLALLDYRRGLTKEQVDAEPLVIAFADELSACIKQFDDPDVVSEALERLGCEGRKYKIVFIALNQSINVKDNKDTSAAMLANYLIIRLCAIARQLARQWKKEDPRRKHVEETDYSCVVCGSAEAQVAIHPTHHSYKKYKKKGNKPKNLLNINQLPLTIELASPDDIKNDWHEDLIAWADKLKETPTPDVIKAKWTEMMGQEPSSKQVELLHEYLLNRN